MNQDESKVSHSSGQMGMNQNIVVTYQGIHGVTQQLNLGEGSAKEEGNAWSKLFTFNRTISSGMTLNFKPPTVIDDKPVVILEAPEIVKQKLKWNNALAVSTFGEAPALSYMRNYIALYWNFVAKPELYYYDDGFYIVKFQNTQDIDDVLFSGPYSINSKPLILQYWTHDFDFTQELPTTIPL
ncbi:hypothetical protein BC332_19035 [Capsicum chinense]|nr:hypothetical protein BC332_19035 [Capsicum chinense]